MRHQEGFREGEGGICLYWQGWLPEGEAKAVLVVVHGLAEHSGRYGNVVGRLVPKGYAVYAMDHRGHGKSEGDRLFVSRFEDYTSDLAGFLAQVRAELPGIPLFLVGHSMGGLIASLTLLDHQAGLAGAALSGPAIRTPGDLSPAVVRIGRLLSRLCPRLGLVPLEAEGVSRNPDVVRAYLADPLVGRGKITARLGAEMLEAMACVRREAGRITLPLLILQGGADRLVDPAGAKELLDAVASNDKRLILYEGLYHEVYNEPERERVLDDLEQWLDAHRNGA